MESNGWVMWKMGTWLMTHGPLSTKILLLSFSRAACDESKPWNSDGFRGRILSTGAWGKWTNDGQMMAKVFAWLIMIYIYVYSWYMYIYI